MKKTRPILSILSILSIGILVASAARTDHSERTITRYWGLAFPDGVILMLYYPDDEERPLSDAQDRIKAASQWFQLPPK